MGETTVRSFATPHDAADSVGYILENGRHRFGFATDLGFVPQSAAALLRGRQLARCAATASSVLVFAGIFVMRFAFYMMHMTYGMSL